ncbi:hypothetical protein ES703_85892 [subsurface metagenome]
MPNGIQISINLDLKEIQDIIYEQCCESCRDKCWNKILDRAVDSSSNDMREVLRQSFMRKPSKSR